MATTVDSANSGPLVQNPGDGARLASMLRFVENAIKMDLDNCLPAIVVGYDRTSNTATVRPVVMLSVRPQAGGALIRKSKTDIPSVPVLSLGAGKFHISFPIATGDLGWIHANDRDIQLFLQGLKEQPAGQDGASHSFKDAMFIPDVYRNYTINAEDAGAMVIQSTDGATRISVRSDNIKVTAPVGVVIDAPTVSTTQDLVVGGKLIVNGESATLPQVTTVDGVPVYGHDHQGQVPGFS